MNLAKKLLTILALLPALALAEEGFQLDHAPDRSNDTAALQHGAKLFVNYCLNCHAAASMRYNRLRDLGLSEDQIKANLLFTSDKVGGMMTVAMAPKDAKAWFGVVPPDLSVIVRAKSGEAGTGRDYLYTYLRSFYKDDTRPTGWNNMVLHNVAMPHVLWELQGVRTIRMADVKDEEGHVEKAFAGYDTVKPGTLTPLEYDNAIGDLVGYMEWMAEPAAATRKRLGVWVLLFLTGFALLAWRLNASFWKEVK
jgi:ubiquinol-cytochrome c reductase cytochrome c1 subunit